MAAEDPEVLSKPPFLADIQLSPVRASGIWGGKRSNHLSLFLRSRSHRLASVASLNLIPLPPRRRNVPSRTYVTTTYHLCFFLHYLYLATAVALIDRKH